MMRRTSSRILLLFAGLAILVYAWAPWEDGRTRVDRVKQKELFRALDRLHEASAEVEGHVKAKQWAKAAKNGKELIRHIEDARYFGIGDVFPVDDRGKADREFELARVSYVRMVRAIERGDTAQARSFESEARKHYQEAFSWAADY